MHPPHPEWALGGALLARLRQMLADMGEDVGEEMTGAQGNSPRGPSATSLHATMAQDDYDSGWTRAR